MPDSPDQIMHRLEQENRSLKNILKQKDKKLEQKDKKLEQKDKTLKNILKQKDKKLEQKDRELGLERGLWKSRNDGWNPGKGPALHLLEVLDGIIRDGDKLRHVTLADGEQFRYMLERAKVFLTHSGQMPLFRDNASRVIRSRKPVQAIPETRTAPGTYPQKGQPRPRRACRILRDRPDHRVPVHSGDGRDAGRNTSDGRQHIRGGSCCPDQGGFQEDRARVRRGRDLHRRHALPRAAPVRKVSPAHGILRQEEKVH